jgi:hypothetical protein
MTLIGLLLCAVLALPHTATAQQGVAPPSFPPTSLTVPPPGFTTNAKQAMAIARQTPEIRKVLRQYSHVTVTPAVFGGWHWSITYTVGDRQLAEVEESPAGKVMKIWDGVEAESYLSRSGVQPNFRRPWVWIPFALLFLLPFVDPRNLRRLIHLDLLALLSFGVSMIVLDRHHPVMAILLFYPPLAYLLVRALLAGLRPRRRKGRLVPFLPTAALAVGVIALFGARVALNVESTTVMDIGYASVVGADRITHKQQLYVNNDQHGDTYGPINYLAYVPFELALPWNGTWDRLWAAHAATLAFDLLTLLGLFLLGRQMRAGPEGRRLGLAMAWAWAAFPFTLLGVMDNTNDGLIAMFLVWMLVVFNAPAARGAMLGLATAAKFFPGALLLVVARGRGDEGRRAWAKAAAACIGIFVFTFAIYWPAGGLGELWACTFGFQLSRPPDLSFWTIFWDLRWTQKLIEGLTMLLILGLAVMPGRRTIGQIAAVTAAITIALQIPAGHWYYYYIMWFAPMLLVGLFSEHRDGAGAVAEQPGDVELPGLPVVAEQPLALAG